MGKSMQFSRRNFLAGTALATGAGLALPTLAGSTAGMQAKAVEYGPAPGVAKLNANENPYGPSPLAIEAMTEAVKKGAYYVNSSATTLREMIAERHGLSPEYIALSSGSSGVLTNLAMAAASEGNILGPDLFWDTTSKMGTRNSPNGIKRLAKTVDLSIDLDAMYAAIEDDTAMVQICNPNNPTGSVVSATQLKAFCLKASQKSMVLVDEAYNELTDDPEANSMVPLVKAGHNVVVARTFSKIYGLAGMRVGYMIAKPETLEIVGRYGMGSYGLNQAGIAAAIASYNDMTFLKYSKVKIIEAREMIAAAVKANGLTALPTQTSFMFVDLGKLNAEKFRAAMAEQNVLIRGIYQDYTNWSRVSTGTLPHVQMYVDAMPKVLDQLA